MTQVHKLPADLHEAIYKTIADRYLPQSRPQAQPVAIITGGQPGAGKSGITDRAKAELGVMGGYVLVDADKVRTRHPDYARLMREDDTTAANKTHPDAGAWAGRLGRDAIATKRNVIFDQTSKDPAAVLGLAAKLREAGYRVELRVMAVNPLVSEQRIHMRYESQKAATGHGRFSTKDNHDAAFAGVLKSVEAAETSRAVDAIKVHDKDHRVIYSAMLEHGAWSRGPGAATNKTAAADKAASVMAASVMAAERARPLTLEEKAQLASNYERITQMLGAPGRNATAVELAAVGGLADQALRHYLAHALREGVDHPGLAQPREILRRMGDQAEAHGLRGQARDHALKLGAEILARAMERGEPLNKVARDYFGAGAVQADKAAGLGPDPDGGRLARGLDRGPER